MIDHLSIQCADVAGRAPPSTTPCWRPLGGTRIMDFGEVIGYGVRAPDVLARPGCDRRGLPRVAHRVHRPRPGRGAGLLRRGGRRRAPRCCTSRACGPSTTPTYYGAFVRDPDGNNVEAVCHRPE